MRTVHTVSLLEVGTSILSITDEGFYNYYAKFLALELITTLILFPIAGFFEVNQWRLEKEPFYPTLEKIGLIVLAVLGGCLLINVCVIVYIILFLY